MWAAAIPDDLAEVMREVFDLPTAGKDGRSSPSVVKRHKQSIDTLRRKTLETARDGSEGGNEATNAEEPSRYDDDEEDEEDEEDEPHVLGGDGLATPWRSLGALASQANKAAHKAKTQQAADDDDDDDDDVEATKEVVRKAKAELKDARSKRITVMKMVEDAATPHPAAAKSRAAKARPSASPRDLSESATTVSSASSGYSQSSSVKGRRSNENVDPDERRSTSARSATSKADKKADKKANALRPSTRATAKAK